MRPSRRDLTSGAGALIRPVADGEEQAKVDTHRRAWKPVELPFTDGSGAGIDPDAESRFDADGYAAMQAAAVYRRDLDLVIEAPDGSLAVTATLSVEGAPGPIVQRFATSARTSSRNSCRKAGSS